MNLNNQNCLNFNVATYNNFFSVETVWGYFLDLSNLFSTKNSKHPRRVRKILKLVKFIFIDTLGMFFFQYRFFAFSRFSLQNGLLKARSQASKNEKSVVVVVVGGGFSGVPDFLYIFSKKANKIDFYRHIIILIKPLISSIIQQTDL